MTKNSKPDKKTTETSKPTIKKVYWVYKPLSINSPSLPPSVNSGGDEKIFTRDTFLQVLRKVSRPGEDQSDEEETEA